MQWFRLHAEAVDDEKLRLLAFEDRWHFVAILCCKATGILDCEDLGLMRRKVAVKLGLDSRELDEVVRRLAEVGLVDQSSLQPVNWAKRQYESDSSTERTRRWRKKRSETSPERHGNVSVTPPDTDTDTDTDTEKKKTRAARGAPKALVCVSDLVSHGVDKQSAEDWLAIRKTKRLPLTATAWRSLCEQAARAMMTPAAAVQMAASEGWAGFKANWVVKARQAAQDDGGADRARIAADESRRWLAEQDGQRRAATKPPAAILEIAVNAIKRAT